MSITQIQTFNPATTPNGNIPVSISGDCATLYLFNESLESLLLVNNNDESIIGILPALWAQPFVIARPKQSVAYNVISSQNAQDSTLQQVQGVWYDSQEDTSKLYSGPLPRIANVGNPSQVQTTVSGNTLVNTSNAPGTQVSQVASTGATGNTFTLSTDGLMNLAVTIAGVLVQVLRTFEPSAGGTILQLGASSYLAEILGNLQVDGVTTLTGKVTATNASNNILAANVPATGVTAGALPAGVTLPGSQLTGSITATAIAAANVAAGSLASGVILTSVAANATLAATLAAGANLPGGKLGKAADADILDASGGATVLKATGGTNSVQLSAPGGIALINSAGQAIGTTDAGKDLLDWGSGTNPPVYMKAKGGGFVFQSPSGTNQWTKSKENSGTVVAVSNGTVTVTHNMGRVPDRIKVTPNNGAAGSQTFAIWNVTSTTFQIYNAANTPTYWWEATNN